MATGKMISLKKWAERLDPSPHPNTLLNWRREGKIIPCPIKLGRSYYVSEHAIHIQEYLNGPTVKIS